MYLIIKKFIFLHINWILREFDKGKENKVTACLYTPRFVSTWERTMTMYGVRRRRRNVNSRMKD